MRETLARPLELKSISDAGSFNGLAAVYGNVDQGGDRICKGAFTKTLAERGARVPILWQHDEANPIGSGALSDSEAGLVIKGQLDLDVEEGRRAYSGLRGGYIGGLSIGYTVVKKDWNGGVRELKELKLYEVSIVTFPMNEEAIVSGVKALADLARKEGRAISAATGEKLSVAHGLLDDLLASHDAAVAMQARQGIIDGTAAKAHRAQLKAARAMLAEFLPSAADEKQLLAALREWNAETRALLRTSPAPHTLKDAGDAWLAAVQRLHEAIREMR
jgi:HK97 family phage prohead protease